MRPNEFANIVENLIVQFFLILLGKHQINWKLSLYFVASQNTSLYEIYPGKKCHIQIQTLDMKFLLVFTFKSFSKERKKGIYALL